MRTLDDPKSHMVTCIVLVLVASSVATWAQQQENAALLYYQAFLLHEKPDDGLVHTIGDYGKGKIEGNEKIAEHIEKNRSAIASAVKAADMDTCDWGYDYSQGFDLQMPHLPQVRRIAFLLSAEARSLAERGDYATALDRCITLRKMAGHVTDRTLITYLVGLALNGLANGAAQNILGLMPGDVKELSEFKNRLSQTQERFPTLEYTYTQEAQVCAESMRKEKAETLITLMRQGNDSVSDSTIRRLRGDEAFFERNRNHYANAIGTIIDTLESSLSYQEICIKLDELDRHFCGEASDNPDATLTAMALPATKRILQLRVRQQTHVNALCTAIDLYMAKATTGRLPDTLSANAPNDLFSGKPFRYEKTADGFVLHCQGKDLDKDKAYEFEFKVAK